MTREKLQLVGVTSFLVAAKQHEPQPPHPDDCAYWTDHGRAVCVYLCLLGGIEAGGCVCIYVYMLHTPPNPTPTPSNTHFPQQHPQQPTAYSGPEVEQMEQRVTRVYSASLHIPNHAHAAAAPAAPADATAAAGAAAAAAAPLPTSPTAAGAAAAATAGAGGHHSLPFPPPTAFDFLTLYLQVSKMCDDWMHVCR